MGFPRTDRVFVGGTSAETRFLSGNTLQFVVPRLQPGSYEVEIRNDAQTDPAGMLRIDAAPAGADTLPEPDFGPADSTTLSVLPARLDLRTGERRVLAFALAEPAPSDGLYLNVTTDIPTA